MAAETTPPRLTPLQVSRGHPRWTSCHISLCVQKSPYLGTLANELHPVSVDTTFVEAS